ncbi:hypothetical protein SLA2020_069650 [Shorea laevis]
MAKIEQVFSAIHWLYSQLTLLDIAVALLSLFILSCLRERLIRNKGPMLWPVLGISPTVVFHTIADHMHEWFTGALIKVGGTFSNRGIWFGRCYSIVTIDPSNIEYMLKTNFKNFPKGEYYQDRFGDLLGDGIFNVDGESWKVQRWIVKSEMHSTRFVEHSFRTMQDLVQQRLLNLTEKMVRSGEAFDLQEVLLQITFDNICTAALGIDPGCLTLDLPQVPFAKAFEEATELTMYRFLIPPFVWKPVNFFQIGYEKRLRKAIKIVHDFAEETVRERRRNESEFGNLKDKSDLLSRLMESENREQASEKFYRHFCISLILAGRDTTSVGLAWFFWLISKNPEVETKILNEIREILRQRRAEEDEKEDSVFTTEDLKKMVYLQAALSDSLRLYPSVPVEMKCVLEDDVFPDRTPVKKGARIFYCIFPMGRVESIWGRDCLEFKPERWIKDGYFVSENQFKYAVFNGGPRIWIGKKFAYMQMKMVAASILLRYSVQVVEGHRVSPKVTTTLYMKDGLMVTRKPRWLNFKS